MLLNNNVSSKLLKIQQQFMININYNFYIIPLTINSSSDLEQLKKHILI